jgi:DUF1365 family protein
MPFFDPISVMFCHDFEIDDDSIISQVLNGWIEAKDRFYRFN